VRRADPIIAAALLLAVGCIDISLDNPLRYRDVPPEERLGVPCYYALDPATDALVVKEGRYRVKMGPAIAEQLRAALSGLCRGTGRARDREAFLALAGAEPAVLFWVTATASMDAEDVTWAVNSGRVEGYALVSGPGDAAPVRYRYDASGSKRQYVGEDGSGAEGLRHALGDATQRLVDAAKRDRSTIEQLAHEERRGQ
jgi:hypothetical protein